ncbi:WD40 repeat domain-containing protein [Chloracidobacterium validum]|uniref:WD40 repeat domain-containing protein n=1 Tax=Chloracidobacterium validum TaxID=2821543 RepID=A0ABX8B6Y9_9BACT|nr:WD40 repeat domain-containing protein [Chloracidobacterium validum]QUW02726.1 WD40 repeat domain-containing protein [Chloracidobacterium validum]
MPLPSLSDFLKSTMRELATRWQVALDDHVLALHWAPDGDWLAVLSSAGTLVVLDGATDAIRWSRAAHSVGGMALHGAPDGVWLATGGQDGRARIWHAATGELAADLPAGASWVERVVWSPPYPDGKPVMLASAAGKCLRFWTPAGDVVSEHTRHTSTITDMQWHPARRCLVTSSYGLLTVWQPGETTPGEVFAWKGSHLTVRWRPDGKYLVVGDQDATIHVWDTTTGEDLMMSGYATKVRELAWHPRGRFLATGGGSAVTIWDFSGRGPAGSTPVVLEGHAGLVTALAYRPDGKALASGGTDGLLLWRPPEKPGRPTTPVGRYTLPEGVTVLDWHPTGMWLAVGSPQGLVVALSGEPA